VFVLASMVAAPQATAADCRWIAHDLPVPPGVTGARTVSSSSDNSLVLGIHYHGSSRGLVWWNGELWQMDEPPNPRLTAVVAQGINNSALVVGHMVTYLSAGTDQQAFRYQYGKYTLLETEPGERSEAIGVNDAGDIVGEVWSDSMLRTVVVWPANGPRRILEEGDAVGISSDGKVVGRTRLSADTTVGWVTDLATGARKQLPTGSSETVLDNDRILYSSGTEIVELNLDGERVAGYAAGTKPFGRTSGGTLFGATGPGTPTLWQWGTSYAVDAEKQPDVEYYGDVTDGGALIGTYKAGNGTLQPARWFWCA